LKENRFMFYQFGNGYFHLSAKGSSFKKFIITFTLSRCPNFQTM